MGRHSASDEDVDEPTSASAVRSALPEGAAPESARTVAVANGRHSVAEERAGEAQPAAQPAAESATQKLPNLLVESPFSPLLTVRTAPVPRVEPETAAADAAAEPETAEVEPSTAVEPAAAASDAAGASEAVAAGESAPVAPKSSGTRGDLQLLREQPRLRAKCAAAVVVPFLVFTAVLIALGRADVFLIWFWIPTVLAGIFVGALLDRAHSRQRKLASTRDD